MQSNRLTKRVLSLVERVGIRVSLFAFHCESRGRSWFGWQGRQTLQCFIAPGLHCFPGTRGPSWGTPGGSCSGRRKPPGVSQDGPPIASNWSVPAAELGGPVLDQHEAAGGGVVIHATGQEKALAVSVGDMERPWGPGVLRSWGSRALARPKSSTLTVPPGVNLTLAGLRSRWTIPCSWASSRASGFYC